MLVLCHELLHGAIGQQRGSDLAMGRTMWVVVYFPHMGQRQHQALDLSSLAFQFAGVLLEEHADLAQIIETIPDAQCLVGLRDLLPNGSSRKN